LERYFRGNPPQGGEEGTQKPGIGGKYFDVIIKTGGAVAVKSAWIVVLKTIIKNVYDGIEEKYHK
jgi:hypothetical protein